MQKIIRHENSISMPGVGYGGVPSRQWYASAFLISLVTTTELFEMTKDTSEGLRLCAFIGLTYYKYPDLDLVRQSLTGDTTTILSPEGCVIDETTVGYAINHIEQWNTIYPMKQLLGRMIADSEYRSKLLNALVYKKRIVRFNQN